MSDVKFISIKIVVIRTVVNLTGSWDGADVPPSLLCV